MLHQLTWQQFLIAALLLSLIWYGALALLVYRQPIRDFLSGKGKPRVRPGPAAELADDLAERLPEEPESEAEALMGRPAMPDGMSRVAMNLFGFADPLAEGEEAEDRKQRQRGLIPDVMQELRQIFQVLETEQGGKAEFMSLFGLVSSKYPQIRGTADQDYLNVFIRDHVLFPISDRELDALWEV